MSTTYDRMDADEKRRESDANALRTLAFFGVALSTIATMICVVSVPMIYNYVSCRSRD